MLTPVTSRRRFIQRLLQWFALLPLGLFISRQAAAGTPDSRFISRALELARIGRGRGDGTRYGALVVRDGIVIAEGWNRVALRGDATAHAEVEAIREAARELGTRDLTGCTLYTNGGRPCRMCEGAAYFANIDRLVYATTADAVTDAGRPKLGGC